VGPWSLVADQDPVDGPSFLPSRTGGQHMIGVSCRVSCNTDSNGWCDALFQPLANAILVFRSVLQKHYQRPCCISSNEGLMSRGPWQTWSTQYRALFPGAQHAATGRYRTCNAVVSMSVLPSYRLTSGGGCHTPQMTTSGTVTGLTG
jgi:hypothetical protein